MCPWKSRHRDGQHFLAGAEDPKVSARRNAITHRQRVQAQQLAELTAKERALRPIFDKYATEDWKAPLDVVVPTIQEANLLAEAIAFFHGTEAEISQIDVAVPISKDALVHIPRKAYRVVSEGYMG